MIEFREWTPFSEQEPRHGQFALVSSNDSCALVQWNGVHRQFIGDLDDVYWEAESLPLLAWKPHRKVGYRTWGQINDAIAVALDWADGDRGLVVETSG